MILSVPRNVEWVSYILQQLSLMYVSLYYFKARSHSDLRLNHGKKNRQKVVSREADNVVRLDVEFKTS